jgi:circadian clock protein KaiB
MSAEKRGMDTEAGTWELILFVAESKDTARYRAERLNSVFEKYLQTGYRIELVSLLDSPEKALQYDIIAVPTLIRLKPEPVIRIVGDFTDPCQLMKALGMPFPENM